MQAKTNDYSKWVGNIKVTIWGNPLKVDKPDNCPEPDRHTRCVDDNCDCPYWMGYDCKGKNEAFWGDVMTGCCGKLLIEDGE